LWTVDSEGGTPRQITRDPGSQNVSSWSHDGRWVYFTADEGNKRNVFRVGARGGAPEQLTHTGGAYPRESEDGISLLYQPREADSPLLIAPLGGGTVRQLVGCVMGSMFAANRHGIFYVACGASPDPPLHVLDPVTGRDRLLRRLERYASVPGLGVSPDGHTILYTRIMSNSRDLMLIENFK
jgi:hypothetical protein